MFVPFISDMTVTFAAPGRDTFTSSDLIPDGMVDSPSQVCEAACRSVDASTGNIAQVLPTVCEPLVDIVAEPEVVLPLELWAKSMLYLVHDVSLSPVEAAQARAAIACVSKPWKHRVYTMAEFWSYITITRNLGMDRLTFVLSKCTAGPIHIRLILRSIRTVRVQGFTSRGTYHHCPPVAYPFDASCPKLVDSVVGAYRENG
ncbi:hypothetical protein DFH06DRAFT_1367127 [Mycena polygramma]|nr:hypothetical protein DFH06DRAFT_1367127 [Mycena polygramma]